MNTEQTTLIHDELLSIQTLPLAAANGEIDLNDMAIGELINRGLDLSGKWVGFDQARTLLHR
ncbi:hypothetical protein [Nitrosomonas sp. Nm166]|uniref:hypothetical protein n=1 Tax=Nitrosomonas sp. Nm166 TaxID=1881054 RepID=UPI0008F0FEA8|nr:hypothetical protein [Nitrosomonas sp. Nm166]SFF13294.1 hypothetical protein SAMN05428977_10542 [Nitrosomonas sp. Nm166]